MVGFIRTLLVASILHFFFSQSSFGQDKIEYYIEEKNGTYRGAIEIKLDKGWYTYWKHPGANGFKPKIVVLSQKNINSYKFYWPHPKILGPDGYEYIGYDKSPFIPFEIIKLDKEKFLKMELELRYGVCKKICLIRNKVLKIEQKITNSVSNSEKIKNAFKKIHSEFLSFSVNKCKLEKTRNQLFKVTIKNKVLKDKNKINLALIDYMDQNSLITDQTFNPEEGSATAMLSSETTPFENVDLNKINLIFLVDGSARKIIGCSSLASTVLNQSN